jgi:MarR family transcriptional regulator, organic hydroperoxide resistance regulator
MAIRDESQSMDWMLAQVCHYHFHRAHELLEIIGLYRGQPPVLYALWEKEGLSHQDLAKRLHNTPATISRMLQRMEKTGFIQRRPDEQDQRISRVYLTAAGRDIQKELQAIWLKMETETFAGFSPEELELLSSFLLRLRANLVQSMKQST